MEYFKVTDQILEIQNAVLNVKRNSISSAHENDLSNTNASLHALKKVLEKIHTLSKQPAFMSVVENDRDAYVAIRDLSILLEGAQYEIKQLNSTSIGIVDVLLTLDVAYVWSTCMANSYEIRNGKLSVVADILDRLKNLKDRVDNITYLFQQPLDPTLVSIFEYVRKDIARNTTAFQLLMLRPEYTTVCAQNPMIHSFFVSFSKQVFSVEIFIRNSKHASSAVSVCATLTDTRVWSDSIANLYIDIPRPPSPQRFYPEKN